MLKSVSFFCQRNGKGAWELQVSLWEKLALLRLRWRFPLLGVKCSAVSLRFQPVCPTKAGSFSTKVSFLLFLFNQTKPICSCQLDASAPSNGKRGEWNIFLV